MMNNAIANTGTETEDLSMWLSQREIAQFFKQLWGNNEPLEINTECVFADKDRVIIAGAYITKSANTGDVVESSFFIDLRCENGRIVWYRLVEDNLAVLRFL